MMPKPDFLIATSAPCTGGMAVIENLATHYKKDLFVLNMPYDKSEKSAALLALQLKDMLDFVAAHTGRPMDKDRLRFAVEQTNKTRELFCEVYALAAMSPSPVRSGDMKDVGIVTPLFLGTEIAIEIAQAYKDELSMRLKSGQAEPKRTTSACCGYKTGFNLKIHCWTYWKKSTTQP